jgi:hypothetical protein
MVGSKCHATQDQKDRAKGQEEMRLQRAEPQRQPSGELVSLLQPQKQDKPGQREDCCLAAEDATERGAEGVGQQMKLVFGAAMHPP